MFGLQVSGHLELTNIQDLNARSQNGLLFTSNVNHKLSK